MKTGVHGIPLSGVHCNSPAVDLAERSSQCLCLGRRSAAIAAAVLLAIQLDLVIAERVVKTQSIEQEKQPAVAGGRHA
ncbi:hypothetical protein P4S72_01720 [Vibrio sp. PP-XX7]